MHGLIVKYIPIIQIYGILPLNVNTCVLNFQRRQFLLDFLVVVEKPICLAVFISDIKRLEILILWKLEIFFLLKRFLFPAPLYSRTTDRGGGENNWNCKLSPTGNLNIPNRGEPCHHRHHHHHHHHHHNDDDHHSFPHNVMFLISIQIWRQMGAAV